MLGRRRYDQFFLIRFILCAAIAGFALLLADLPVALVVVVTVCVGVLAATDM